MKGVGELKGKVAHNLNICFNIRQEIDRMQRVINTVYNNLCDLKLAIDGTIVMSQYLRQSLDAMYDARIPERWQKVIVCFTRFSYQ